MTRNTKIYHAYSKKFDAIMPPLAVYALWLALIVLVAAMMYDDLVGA